MYTLLWTGYDGNIEISDWHRFSTKEDLEKFIKSLIEEGFSNEDMMVFSPSVDYIVPEADGSI